MTEHPFKVGAVLAQGRYRIDALLGEGRMGSVYRATELMLERPVALKVLHPELSAHPSAHRRLEAEAKALARISSPHVVRVNTFFDEAGTLVIDLEYLEGGSLVDLLDGRGVASDVALGWMGQLLAGLSALHGAGILHLDLRPGNVLRDADGRLKIKDPLVSAESQREEGIRSRLEATRGTLAYMAPEQIAGVGAVDGRTDVYAAGVMLYELLAGCAPFRGNPFEVMGGHVRRDPDLTGVPAQARAVVACALAKDPAKRFQTVEAFGEALWAVSPLMGKPPSSSAGVVQPAARPPSRADLFAKADPAPAPAPSSQAAVSRPVSKFALPEPRSKDPAPASQPTVGRPVSQVALPAVAPKVAAPASQGSVDRPASQVALPAVAPKGAAPPPAVPPKGGVAAPASQGAPLRVSKEPFPMPHPSGASRSPSQGSLPAVPPEGPPASGWASLVPPELDMAPAAPVKSSSPEEAFVTLRRRSGATPQDIPAAGVAPWRVGSEPRDGRSADAEQPPGPRVSSRGLRSELGDASSDGRGHAAVRDLDGAARGPTTDASARPPAFEPRQIGSRVEFELRHVESAIPTLLEAPVPPAVVAPPRTRSVPAPASRWLDPSLRWLAFGVLAMVTFVVLLVVSLQGADEPNENADASDAEAATTETGKPVPTTPAESELVLEVDPPDAAVTVDGKSVRGKVAGLKLGGEVTVIAEAEGFARFEKIVDLDSASVTVAIKLEKAREKVVVVLEPVGDDAAWLVVSGKLLGKGPQAYSGVAGEVIRVEVRPSQDGVPPVIEEVTLDPAVRTRTFFIGKAAPLEAAVGAGSTTERPAAGAAEASGSEGLLQLTARPWASVSIDGRPVGDTPLSRRLASGSHSIRFQKGEQSVIKSVTIVAGETLRLSHDFDSEDGAQSTLGAKGTLQVKARPWAKVLINGRPVGDAPVSMQMAPGIYFVVLTKGAERVTKSVKVEAGRTATVNHAFD